MASDNSNPYSVVSLLNHSTFVLLVRTTGVLMLGHEHSISRLRFNDPSSSRLFFQL